MAKAFSFGEFELVPDQNSLLRDGEPVRLGSRAFSILTILVEHAGEVVTGEALASRVWPDTNVSDSNLRVHLATLRKILNSPSTETDCIVTAPGRGYKFTLPVVQHKASVRQRSQSSLPALLTRLVGRDAVIQEVLQNIDDYRFVTIVGSGGIGKTSVALAAAHIGMDRFEDGASFADLSPIEDVGSLSSAIARALKIPSTKGSDDFAVIDHLRNLRLLLVLDNCEHLIEGTAHLAEQILRECPGISVLATSREPLRAEGEFVRRLLPLQSPPVQDAGLSSHEVMQFPAVQLFVQRAAASLEGFILQDHDALSVAQLCNRLDGIPLAIELAAARVDLFGIRKLNENLDDCLQVLTRGRRTAQERHRTLRAALDWSFHLLTANEQMLLARLGVFRSAFDYDAALAVASDQLIAKDRVLDGIENLVAKSLLTVSLESGKPLYRLLETTRAYAVEMLGVGPAANAVRCRHALNIRDQLRQLPSKGGRVDSTLHEVYSRVIDEMRTAIAWAFSSVGDPQVGLDLVVNSAHLWSQLSLFEEYRRYVEQALKTVRDIPDSAAAEVSLLNAIAPTIYETLGAVPELETSALRVIELARKLNAPAALRDGLHSLWRFHHGRGEYREALEKAEEIRDTLTVDLPDEDRWRPMRGVSLLYLGRLAECRSFLGEFGNGIPIVDDGTSTSFDYNFSSILNGILARVLWLQGDFDMASACAEASVDSALKAKQTVAICFALCLAGCPIHVWNRNIEKANHYLRLLRDHVARSQSIYWDQYTTVFDAGIQVAEGRHLVSPSRWRAKQRHWDYRHWENFSVLGEGFAPESFVERARNDESWWCSAEILRLEALRMHHEDPLQNRRRVCTFLQNALELAQAQGALAWELRIARTLVEVSQSEKEAKEARRLLQRTLEEFSEGFTSSEFQAGERILKSPSRFA